MSNIKKPDLSAPRYRPKRHNIINQEFLKRFRLNYPHYQNISDSKLREIINVFNTQIWETAVNSRDGAEFPEGLGYIFIGSCKSPKKFNTDQITSVKLGTRVQHRNFESDNFLAKIFYTNYAIKYKFQHRELWQFKGIRDFTRTVSRLYPENWKMYLQVDNMKAISKIFKKSIKKDYAIKMQPIITDEYNEFDLD